MIRSQVNTVRVSSESRWLSTFESSSHDLVLSSQSGVCFNYHRQKFIGLMLDLDNRSGEIERHDLIICAIISFVASTSILSSPRSVRKAALRYRLSPATVTCSSNWKRSRICLQRLICRCQSTPHLALPLQRTVMTLYLQF